MAAKIPVLESQVSMNLLTSKKINLSIYEPLTSINLNIDSYHDLINNLLNWRNKMF